jgi:predicted CoA-binding protein
MSKKTLVLGASLNPERYSNMAMQRLFANGVVVKAFGLKKGMVGGTEIDTDLQPYHNIHTVTVYLNPKRQEAYYDYIMGLKPTRIIFNPGTENPNFYKLLDQATIHYEIACTLVLLSTNQY